MGFSVLDAGELWRGKVDVNLLPSSAGHSLDCGGAELAAGLRDAGAAGDAVDGVVVVPTGPLLLLRLDAVVCASPRPFRAVTFVAGAVGTMWKLAVCGWW